MMKRTALIILAVALAATLIASPVMAAKGGGSCKTIPSGEIFYSSSHYLAGQPLKVGFDIFGYNYQAHLFVGSYANVYLGSYGYPPYEGDTEIYYQRLIDEGYAATVEEAEKLMNDIWCWPDRDIWLNMKWNDAWLSNKDCDGDGKLDRYYGYESYIGSGAWETNHMRGEGEQADDWTYFVKIVAVPEDAELVDGIWYTAGGTEIGPVIWGSFAIIQEVESGAGATYVSPAGPGFGKW